MSRGGGRGLINDQHIDVPRLRIEGIDRGFADHRKCLKLCLKVFDNGTLSQPEKQCISSCLGKYRDAQRYMVEKMHKVMHQRAMGNPDIKALYDGVSQEARAQVGDKL